MWITKLINIISIYNFWPSIFCFCGLFINYIWYLLLEFIHASFLDQSIFLSSSRSLASNTEYSYLKNLMFCWLCIVVYQYSKTNEMHFPYSILLWISSLYMFRALLARLQGALRKQQLVYCVRVKSVGRYHDLSSTPTLVAANRHYTHAVYQLLFVQCLLKMTNPGSSQRT
jgi:hypothetical protein